MIKRLYVNNFRCLGNFDLPIADKRSVLLIGKNGAGKSTVCAVLEILQRIAQGTNRAGQLVSRQDFGFYQSHLPIRFEIEVDIDGSSYSYLLALELPEGFKELRVRDEQLSCNGAVLFSRSQAKVDLKQPKGEKSSSFHVDWHLVALPIIQEQSADDPLHIFKNWLSRMLLLAPVPSLINGDSDTEVLTPERNLSNFGAWFSGLIANFPAAYAHVDSFLRRVMPDLKDIKNPLAGTDNRSMQVSFGGGNVIMSPKFQNLSDGEKCFLVCAMVIATCKSYGATFCFWDEPSNYLSLSEVGDVVMELRRSFEVPASDAQLVITSHHPDALGTFPDENVFLLGRRSRLEPTIIRSLNELDYGGNLVDAMILGDLDV